MNNIYIASAVILSKKKELLLVRKKGSEFYQLTGGKIDKNESEIETVLREINEEIGLTVSDFQLKYLGNHETIAVNEKETKVHGTIFMIQLTEDFEPIIANEIEEFVWMNITNYKNYKWAHLAEEFVLPIWLKLTS